MGLDQHNKLKVYEVVHSEPDCRASLGLFSTREKAERFVQDCKDAKDWYAPRYEIQERSVDEHAD